MTLEASNSSGTPKGQHSKGMQKKQGCFRRFSNPRGSRRVGLGTVLYYLTFSRTPADISVASGAAPRALPRHSTACHGNPRILLRISTDMSVAMSAAISTVVRGDIHGCPRQYPRFEATPVANVRGMSVVMSVISAATDRHDVWFRQPSLGNPRLHTYLTVLPNSVYLLY